MSTNRCHTTVGGCSVCGRSCLFCLSSVQVDILRKGFSSDRRPVLDLLAVEGWRALLGLLDGQVSSKRKKLLNILNILNKNISLPRGRSVVGISDVLSSPLRLNGTIRMRTPEAYCVYRVYACTASRQERSLTAMLPAPASFHAAVLRPYLNGTTRRANYCCICVIH